MAETNVAKDLIWPREDSDVLARVVWLYVGQGSSILVLVADERGYRSLLLDINLDEKNGGIDVPRLMHDLLGEGRLDVFVNTHPHDDHLTGIIELSEEISIGQVWHSGHVPGEKYRDSYDNLRKVIEKVKKSGGKEVKLRGSRSAKGIGDAQYYVLAPAKYVDEEIGDEKPEERYKRIHEHCAVLRFGSGDKWVLVTGDSDRTAFKDHITDYHKEGLSAVVLDASHHGSRDFFKESEEDEDPYLKALETIAPEYVVISAPTAKESPHGHPHQDAVELYEKQVGSSDNVLHTGQKRYCFICDIYRDGKYSIWEDKGALVEAYPLNTTDGGRSRKLLVPTTISTRVDDRPMGS
jgi:beta-lactamase superfamily II metal-dependent hydrolase